MSSLSIRTDLPITNMKDLSPAEKVGQDSDGLTCLGSDVTTEFVSQTTLPTATGDFLVRAYRSKGSLRIQEPIALVCGDLDGKSEVPVRVHDQCMTSEVLGSLRCDCKEQLEYSKQYIQNHTGIVIYLPQEGRGLGLANKISAYSLQERLGVDTVDGNRFLGFEDDYRTYECVKFILEDLNVLSIRLMTNNPRKIKLLEALGIQVDDRIPIVMKAGTHNKAYMSAKALRMDHFIHKDECVSPVSSNSLTASISPSSSTPASPCYSSSSSTVHDNESGWDLY